MHCVTTILLALAPLFAADQMSDLQTCLSGTPIGKRLDAALAGCPAQPADEADKIKALVATECTPFEKAKELMKYNGKTAVCALQAMGWMYPDYILNIKQIQEDSWKDLPAPGGKHIKNGAVAKCMNSFHDKFKAWDPQNACYASYTAEQQAFMDSASDDELMLDCLMYVQGCSIENWDSNIFSEYDGGLDVV